MARPLMPRPPIATFFELACSPSVVVYVGAERQLYTVPVDLLCHWSPFFAACFRGHFKEAVSREVFLPEELPAFFDIFLEYICGGARTCTSLLLEQLKMKGGRIRTYLGCKARTRLLQINFDNEEPGLDFDLSAGQLSLDICVDFIKFCDRLDFAQVSEAAEDALRVLLMGNIPAYLGADDFVFMADVLHHESGVFRLLMQVGIDAVEIEVNQPPHERILLNLASGNSRISAGIVREWERRNPGKAGHNWLESILNV